MYGSRQRLCYINLILYWPRGALVVLWLHLEIILLLRYTISARNEAGDPIYMVSTFLSYMLSSIINLASLCDKALSRHRALCRGAI